MDAIAGCSHCGHTKEIAPTATAGQRVGPCPCCGSSLRALGPLGSRLLAPSSTPRGSEGTRDGGPETAEPDRS